MRDTTLYLVRSARLQVWVDSNRGVKRGRYISILPFLKVVPSERTRRQLDRAFRLARMGELLMKKVRLYIDTLTVETFATASVGNGDGTMGCDCYGSERCGAVEAFEATDVQSFDTTEVRGVEAYDSDYEEQESPMFGSLNCYSPNRTVPVGCSTNDPCTFCGCKACLTG